MDAIRPFAGGAWVAQRSCAYAAVDRQTQNAQMERSLILYGLGKTEVFQKEDGSVLQKDRGRPAACMAMA